MLHYKRSVINDPRNRFRPLILGPEKNSSKGSSPGALAGKKGARVESTGSGKNNEGSSDDLANVLNEEMIRGDEAE